jgi:tetratricopeptide (TPR) repeat protein
MASPWSWGYFGYYNPYWAGPVGGMTYINYSQPVVVAAPTPNPAPVLAPAAAPPGGNAPPPPSVPTTPIQRQGLGILANAQTLFRQGQYQAALNEANLAAAQLPNDSLVHEFRALCLFALHDYQQAAAAVHAVVSVGPGWNWATVSNLYGNPTAYAEQLRALEQYCNDQPTAAAPRFLLAYHYLLAEHNNEAAAVLQDVVNLEPDDQLAAQLLKGLTTPADRTTPPGPPTPGRPVDRQSIVGHWRASRSDGSTFDLNLTDDGKFQWTFKQQEREQQLAGNFTLADNYLILSAGDQNALVGHVSMDQQNHLNFRLAGGNPSEPGLSFTR